MPRLESDAFAQNQNPPRAHRWSIKKQDLAALPMERLDEGAMLFESDVIAEPLPLTPNAPEILDTILRNALLLIDYGDYKSSINLLRNILLREPCHADAIEWLGYCFNKLGDTDNAIKCFTQLVNIQPDDFSFSQLAEMYYQTGNYRKSEELYHTAIKRVEYESPLLFNIYKNLGNISLKAADFDSAEENYNKAFAISQHSDVLYVNFGTLELQKGDIEMALSRFRQALELNLQNDKAWVGIALIHWQKGDHELAFANVDRALDIDPLNHTALKFFAQWCFASLNAKRATKRLEQAAALASGDFEIAVLLIESYFREGKYKSARLELERAQLLEPDSEIAQIFDRLIKEEEAKRHVRLG